MILNQKKTNRPPFTIVYIIVSFLLAALKCLINNKSSDIAWLIYNRITLNESCVFSLRETYGRVFSLKMGSYKFVMASTPEAVKEMLVQRSADYAGRQQTYFFQKATLGRLLVHHVKMWLLQQQGHSTLYVIRKCLSFTYCDDLLFSWALRNNINSTSQGRLERSLIWDFEYNDHHPKRKNYL